jgi:hypothetical protein
MPPFQEKTLPSWRVRGQLCSLNSTFDSLAWIEYTGFMKSPNRVLLPVVFSPVLSLVFGLWVYVVIALVAISNVAFYSHAMAAAASFAAGVVLEWLRSRGSKEYAVVFLILLTLAPILYRYQHG